MICPIGRRGTVETIRYAVNVRLRFDLSMDGVLQKRLRYAVNVRLKFDLNKDGVLQK